MRFVEISNAPLFAALDAARAEHSAAYDVDLGGPSAVQQHEKDEADINVIMRRFGLTGALPEAVGGAVYGDFTGLEDFDDAVQKVEGARRDFMLLPAAFRERFGNDPSRLVSYAQRTSPEEFQRLLNDLGSPTPPAKVTEPVS